MYLDFEILSSARFFKALTDLVDHAKKRVYIITYNFSLTRYTWDIVYGLVAKAKENVDVKVILNGASSKALKQNRKLGSYMNKLGFKNVVYTSKFLHTKLYVIDDYVITGSHNLAREVGVDISLLIRSKKLADKLLEVVLNSLKGYVYAQSIRGTIDGVPYEVVLNTSVITKFFEIAKEARDYIKILMYLASLSKVTKKFYMLLREKADENVDIFVLLNGTEDMCLRYNRPVWEYMRNLGLETMLSKIPVHAKLLVTETMTLIGSHNLTSSSIAGRVELSVAFRNAEMSEALSYFFDNVWKTNLAKTAKRNALS